VGLLVFAGMDASRLWLVPLFYATYAVGHALFTILFLATIADYFGTRRYASLQGIIQMAGMPLGIALPIITGLVFDRTGTFSMLFVVYAVMASLGALAVYLVRRPTWGELRSRQAPPPPTGAAAVATAD
jgi:hypothetical protein